jgi:hypothetical protein
MLYHYNGQNVSFFSSGLKVMVFEVGGEVFGGGDEETRRWRGRGKMSSGTE